MNDKFDKQLQTKHIKPTAMRQLVLQVLTEQKTALSLPELEEIFVRADKATLYRTLKTFEKNVAQKHKDKRKRREYWAILCQSLPETEVIEFKTITTGGIKMGSL